MFAVVYISSEEKEFDEKMERERLKMRAVEIKPSVNTACSVKVLGLNTFHSSSPVSFVWVDYSR